MTNFKGQKLRAARDRRGLTQQELAVLAGIQRETVNHAERGMHKPAGETVAKLAKALEVPMESLFEDGVS